MTEDEEQRQEFMRAWGASAAEAHAMACQRGVLDAVVLDRHEPLGRTIAD